MHRVTRATVPVAVALALAAWSATGAAAAPAHAAQPQQATQQQQASCFFPKTKFVFHAGLAFGAFHRYIYKPFRAGTFTGSGKVAAIAKAAVASVFVYHEIHEALKQASCSHTLTVLVSPLTAVLTAIKTAEDKLKSGGLPDIASLGTSFDSIGKTAGGIGAPIKDLVHGL